MTDAARVVADQLVADWIIEARSAVGHADAIHLIDIVAAALDAARREERRATLMRAIARELKDGHCRLLEAPCIFCGYSGKGYWQASLHHPGCPWFAVAGSSERHAAALREGGA